MSPFPLSPFPPFSPQALPRPTSAADALANVDAIFAFGALLAEKAGIDPEDVLSGLLDFLIEPGDDNDIGRTAWDKRDYGEGLDDLRHCARAASLTDGRGSHAFVVLLLGSLKEVGDASVLLLAWLAYIASGFDGPVPPSDWDMFADLRANVGGIDYSFRNSVDLLHSVPSQHLRRP